MESKQTRYILVRTSGALAALASGLAFAAAVDVGPSASESPVAAVTDDAQLNEILDRQGDTGESRSELEQGAQEKNEAGQDAQQAMNDAKEMQQDVDEAQQEAQQDVNEATQEGTETHSGEAGQDSGSGVNGGGG